MEAKHSKVEQICDAIRLGLQRGHYRPGVRIDPESLAQKHRTSLTPVRYAFYCLWSDGVLEDHGRAGYRAPLPTEVSLRGQYNWMEFLLIQSCNLTPVDREPTAVPALNRRGVDVVVLTQQLFDAIASDTQWPDLSRSVQLANERLAATRHTERQFCKDALGELAEINRLWLKRDLPRFRQVLFEYHERRRALVPRLVAVMVRHAAKQDAPT
ncbi:MAG TPA: hypothetical protein VGE51_09425 [Fontimonas sp.]